MKIKFITCLLVTIFFSLIFRGTVLAADFNVTGIVTDNSNNPIANAKVTVTNVLTQQTISSAGSDHSGYYSLSVSKGTYNIVITPPLGSGLQPITYSHITVASDMKLRSSINTVSKSSTAASNSAAQPQNTKLDLVRTVIIALIIIVILGVGGFLLFNKKKTLQSPSK